MRGSGGRARISAKAGGLARQTPETMVVPQRHRCDHARKSSKNPVVSMALVPNRKTPTFLRVMPKGKLYSYVRFSSREQAKGDSLHRQTEMARRYAEEHGYVLDTSLDLHDKGISGFKGANRAKGRLGDFLRTFDYSREAPKLGVKMWKAITCILLDMVMVETREASVETVPPAVSAVEMSLDEYRYLTRSAVQTFQAVR